MTKLFNTAKRDSLKKLIFKYTVKLPSKETVDTHYVAAYSEDLARENLANYLKITPSLLRLSPKNLPYIVRQAIEDPNNLEYFLTLDVRIKPTQETNTEELKQHFNLKATLLTSIRYKVLALARQDPQLLVEYSEKLPEEYTAYEKKDLIDHFTYGQQAFKKAYNDIRSIIIKEGFEDYKISATNEGQYILDILDATYYSLSLTDYKIPYQNILNSRI